MLKRVAAATFPGPATVHCPSALLCGKINMPRLKKEKSGKERRGEERGKKERGGRGGYEDREKGRKKEKRKIKGKENRKKKQYLAVNMHLHCGLGSHVLTFFLIITLLRCNSDRT